MRVPRLGCIVQRLLQLIDQDVVCPNNSARTSSHGINSKGLSQSQQPVANLFSQAASTSGSEMSFSSRKTMANFPDFDIQMW